MFFEYTYNLPIDLHIITNIIIIMTYVHGWVINISFNKHNNILNEQ
jgi:hypothetical protein